jgi:ABC-type multidrug transport system fused ATPase/permease subunit
MIESLLKWRSEFHKYGLTDRVIILLIFISVTATFAEMVSIGIFLPLFEIINSGMGSDHGNNSIAYIESFYSSVGLKVTTENLLITTFLIFLASKIILFIGQYIQSYYLGLMLKKKRDSFMSLYLRASSKYYDQVSIGDMTNRTTTELRSAVSGVMLPIKYLITIISGSGAVVILLLLSYELTLLSVFMIFISTLIPMRWVKATVKAGRKNSRYNSVITSFLLDRLRSPRLVRLSGTAAPEKITFSMLIEKQRRLTLTLHLLKARIDLFLEPVIIGVSLSMLYIALEVLKLDFSVIMLYLIVMIRLIPIVKTSMTQLQSINRVKGSIELINQVFDEMQKDVNKREFHLKNHMPINTVNKLKVISLEEVCYKYEYSKANVLSNINLNFKQSTLTAIVGPSGSGKSTLIDIVSGFRESSQGNVKINGIILEKYSKNFLSSFVSFVPQDPQLFDGSIFSHIAYGRAGSTKENVISAAKLSGAYDFIMQLPNEFDYKLLEGASNLSGGQKQRIDIARALLRDTPLLILDEPTSGLDAISESLFNQAIYNIRNTTNKIIIVISHNVIHINNYDQIVVLQDGIVTGVGQHNSLLSNNEWYKEANS